MRDWQYIVINFTMYFGIFIGCSTIRYDFKNRRLKQSKILKIVMFISNFSFITTIPYAVKTNLSHIQLNVKNPLIAYAIALTICMRLIFMVMITLMRGKRDGDLVEWFDKYWLMQTSYFERFQHVTADTSLRKFLILNQFLMFCHCFTLTINVWEMCYTGNISLFFDIYILCCIINFQHYTMWHHAVLLCYLHEGFSKINYQLEHFEMDPKLSLIYYQLTELVKELNSIYSPVLMWIQLSLIITNSVVGYVFILYISSANVQLNAYAYLLGGRLYILLGIHMYVYFIFCDRVTNNTQKTGHILQQYNIRNEEAEIEKISLNLLLSKVSICIQKMFKINLKSFFSILAQTLLLTIVLVQVDLQNKRK